MDREDNLQFSEANPQSDYQPIYDNGQTAESLSVSEFVPVNEDNDNRSAPEVRRQKKNNVMSIMTGTFVTAVASVVVGITGMLNVNMTASFKAVTFSDGVISYEVAVEEMSENDSLTAYLYDDDKLIQTVPLIDEDGDGIVKGQIAIDIDSAGERLNEKAANTIKYRLNLKGVVGLNVERSFDSYVVSVDKVISEFNNVEGRCNCEVDGNYYFKMDFRDDLKLFGNFTARISDNFGNVAECIFSDNLHDEQKIDIQKLKGSCGRLTITFEKDGVVETVLDKEIKY